jgi:hypothetical protein
MVGQISYCKEKTCFLEQAHHVLVMGLGSLGYQELISIEITLLILGEM